MDEYEAKTFYTNANSAGEYEDRFGTSVSLSNLRAKIVGWGEKRAFSRMIDQVPERGRVLDIACGTGRYTETLLSRGYLAGGVDISSAMLGFAEKRVGHYANLLALPNADAESLPFADSSFDGTTCMRLFHRVPPVHRSAMIQEVKRVTKDWAILFFGAHSPWLNLRQSVRSTMIPGRRSNPYPIEPSKIFRLVSENGFEVKDFAWVLPRIAEGIVVLARH